MDLTKQPTSTVAPDLQTPEIALAPARSPKSRVLYECDECGDDECDRVTACNGKHYCDDCYDDLDLDEDHEVQERVVHVYHGTNYVLMAKTILIIGLVLCGCWMQVEGQKETSSTLFTVAMLAFWFMPSGLSSDD